ncbi:MAG: hypothetical protein LDLANPLL_02231 [Turneriella sp.]|nr:hypothetical protein [Turneriella sp.]
MHKREAHQSDPIKRQPDRGYVGDDLSPMAPPEAYAPPAKDLVSPEQMHPFLRRFIDEHTLFRKELNIFEEAILSIQNTGFTKELDHRLKHFFQFFDHDFIVHSRREEVVLFPLLDVRLRAAGEHGRGAEVTTPVDLMEDDHVKSMQLAAVVLNFLGLAFRLPDERSRLIVLDAALEQGKNLVELLRLHMFREDNVLFSLAHRLISNTEFEEMDSKGHEHLYKLRR